MAELICLAANTNLTLPKETRVFLDINRKQVFISYIKKANSQTF